jgi:hypothetical protein
LSVNDLGDGVGSCHLFRGRFGLAVGHLNPI